MGANISFSQMKEIFSVLTDHDIDVDKCRRRLLESKLLADLACAIGTDRLPDRYAFRKVLGLEPTAADFKIWRVVKLGSKMDVYNYRNAMEKGKFDIRYCNEKIFDAAAKSATNYSDELDLVLVTLSDLGIWSGNYATICTRAQEIGLALCPAEVGILLRLQYTDQPKGERLLIGMGPFAEDGSSAPKPSYESRYHFAVCREDGFHDAPGSLSTYSAEDTSGYSSTLHKFIFVRARK